MIKIEDLKASVNSICMKDEMRREIINRVDQEVRRPKSRKSTTGKKGSHTVKSAERRRKGWGKIAAAAAVLIVVSGFIAFPVRALVNSFVREHLEAMSEKEVVEIVNDEMSIRAAANGYTRAYTDSENARYQVLAESYQSGVFPEKEINKVDSKENVKRDEVCFIIPDSTFYLPERELTDEEILEIIDFDVKRNYALRQNYEREYAEEMAQKEEEQKEQIADNVADGGITKQKAIEISTEKLFDIFGNRGEGMELLCRYEERSNGSKGEPCYITNWTNEVTHKIYYIDLSARDGRVLWAAQTDPESLDAPDIPIGEAVERISVLKKQAEEFMEKMNVSYENIYVYYLESADGMAYGDGVRFIFETSEKNAYGVTYQWNGTMHTYAEINLADYQGKNGEMRIMHISGEEVEMKQVFQKLNENPK